MVESRWNQTLRASELLFLSSHAPTIIIFFFGVLVQAAIRKFHRLGNL